MFATSKKVGLLLGASTLALGMAFTAAPAQAFEDVNWTWDATVKERIVKNVDIDIDIDPTGMVMLEDLQVQIGDVTAVSNVHGIYNNQPTGSEGGPVEVDLGSITLDADYGLGGSFLPGGTANPTVGDEGPGDLSPTVTSGEVDETDDAPNGVNGNVMAEIDLGTITVETDPMEADPLDALTELPEIISAATAVGNNTSINADTAVQLHEAQVLVGFESAMGEDGQPSLDDLRLANIRATSTVYDILNGTVDSSATAVGNNLTVDVEADGPDRLMMADVIQVSAANVTARSDVHDITLDNYTNLGALDRPIVNSVATAVGNNKSISVNAPDVDVDPGL